MTHRVFIDGAAGTTGLEIADRLKDRAEFELVRLDDDQRKDTAARREALNECDIAILCLPDEAAREAVALVDPASRTRIIDASSAHRTQEGWCYGFPELLGQDRIANARRVSNPGCYPTGFLALVAPLVRDGLLPTDRSYTVNAVSGYSGGGKGLIERFAAQPDIAFRAYGLGLDHKHLPEMQQLAGLAHAPVFSPSVIAAMRGMIVDVPLALNAMADAATGDALRDALAQFYAGQKLIRLHDDQPAEILIEDGADPWDSVDLWVFANDDNRQARLVARLDNLGKGASGAAVQNLNLMCGLPETAGLRLPKN